MPSALFIALFANLEAKLFRSQCVPLKAAASKTREPAIEIKCSHEFVTESWACEWNTNIKSNPMAVLRRYSNLKG